jgi:multidrug efflux pump subunit AcrA (membrane-fusion protein)
MRRLLFAGTAGVVVVGGGVAAMTLGSSGDGNASPKPTASYSTAEITRGDLVDTSSVDGTLTYNDSRSLSIGATGMVTWVPALGKVVTRGKTLLKVDNKPVTLFYGKLPLYRALKLGVAKGPDVKQLESNLAALGYGDSMTVDDTFTAATAAAIKDWQDDRGLAKTGMVDASQVVYQRGAIRIKEDKVSVGTRTSPGQPAFTVTDTDRRVHVDLDASKQDLAKEGAACTVELPGGDSVKGHITSVGSVATTSGSGEDKTTTIDVDITVDGGKTGKLDQAPVTVDLESDRAKNVLSVPVEALLALREGGFAVQVVQNGAVRLVAVTTGLYGGGRVEVKGDGLSEGMKVEVPST